MKQKLKVCWVSAGVSSFMAGYLAGNVDEFIYIDIENQHPDSMRFIKDCEKALGKSQIGSKKREVLWMNFEPAGQMRLF